MHSLATSLRQTLQSGRLLLLIYGITLALGLLAAIPFFNTLQVEGQNSLAFLKLLNGFDYTVFSDFMHRSGRVVSPLISVGRCLGVVYIFLSLFFAGGILLCFSQPAAQVNSGLFWQGCSQYIGRFLRLFGVSLLFVVIGGGIWLVIGTLVSMVVSDTYTERGLFWIGVAFFALFAFTATLILCIGDMAKVLMFQENERSAFRAFGRAGRLVFRHPGQTIGLYWLLILLGTGLFGVYFLLDDAILMGSWATIFAMFLIQQLLIFGRILLKVWWLGTAYTVYQTFPRPLPVLPPASSPIEPATETDNDSALNPLEPESH